MAHSEPMEGWTQPRPQDQYSCLFEAVKRSLRLLEYGIAGAVHNTNGNKPLTEIASGEMGEQVDQGDIICCVKDILSAAFTSSHSSEVKRTETEKALNTSEGQYTASEHQYDDIDVSLNADITLESILEENSMTSSPSFSRPSSLEASSQSTIFNEQSPISTDEDSSLSMEEPDTGRNGLQLCPDLLDAAPQYIPALAAAEVEEILFGSFNKDTGENKEDTHTHCCYVASHGQSSCALHPTTLDSRGQPMPLTPISPAPPASRTISSRSFPQPVIYLVPWQNKSGEPEANADTSDGEDGKEKKKSPYPMALWEFLLELLHYDCYKHVICWLNQSDGVFKIVNSQALSRLWGIYKRREEMNFDKMSRAMRYYYNKGILIRNGRATRLVYTFGGKIPWESFQPHNEAYAGRLFLPQCVTHNFQEYRPFLRFNSPMRGISDCTVLPKQTQDHGEVTSLSCSPEKEDI